MKAERTIEVSVETYDNLDGIRREGETLTSALDRMARALRASGVVATGTMGREASGRDSQSSKKRRRR